MVHGLSDVTSLPRVHILLYLACLPRHPDTRSIRGLQHTVSILDIGCLDTRLLPLDHEARLLQQCHDLIVGQFKASRVGDTRRVVRIVYPVAVVVVTVVPGWVILKMPQQRADIDEDAARLETGPDHLQVPNQVGRGVEEEDARHGVVRLLVVLAAVAAQKVGRAHGHGLRAGGLPQDGRGVDVGDGVAAEVVGAGEVVGEGVHPGVDGVVVDLRAFVDDVLRG